MIARIISVACMTMSSAWAAAEFGWEPLVVLVASIGSYVVSEVSTYKNGNDKNSDHREVTRELGFDTVLGIYRDDKSGITYCPKCAKEGILAPLSSTNPKWMSTCNSCGSTFTGPEYCPITII